MRILITENQLNTIIDRYITLHVGGEIIEKKSQQKRFGKNISFFVNSNGKIIFEYNKLKNHNEVSVNYRLWRDIKDMFNIPQSETGRIIKEWIYKHTDIKDKFKIKLNPDWFQHRHSVIQSTLV